MEIQQAFTLDRTLINLNNGGVCPSPRVVLDAMRRWSDDELRSLNAQIEYVLRAALRREGRLKLPPAGSATEQEDES